MHYYFVQGKEDKKGKHTNYIVVETDINNISRWVKEGYDNVYELLPDTFDQCGVLMSD